MDSREMSRSRESDSASKTDPTDGSGATRSAFVARLRAIAHHWPSADRLARATGVSPSAFRKWLKGEAEPSRERLVALAEAAQVSVGWLATGEGPEPRLQTVGKSSRARSEASSEDTTSAYDDFILLPKHPEAAAAGAETPFPPSDTDYLALRRDWVRATLGVEPDALHVEIAIGQCMQPSVCDGDLLFVDTSVTRFTTFGVYVLEVAGERLVKRVQPKLDGSLTLISDNPAYEIEHIPAAQADDVRVLGRVVWICGPLRP
jgi:phage repressor protein C with HTH and peptisase S24 domain